jgi:hypothetical protein
MQELRLRDGKAPIADPGDTEVRVIGPAPDVRKWHQRNELAADPPHLRAPSPDMHQKLPTIEAVMAHVRAWFAECGSEPAVIERRDPLVAHAIELAGRTGIARRRVLEIFSLLGEEQTERALSTLLAEGAVHARNERRVNSDGGVQWQPVYRVQDPEA